MRGYDIIYPMKIPRILIGAVMAFLIVFAGIAYGVSQNGEGSDAVKEVKNTYRTETFTLEVPEGWTTRDMENTFSANAPDQMPTFTHATGEFHPLGWGVNAGQEQYTGAQGITWTINYSKASDEFLHIYSEHDLFVTVKTNTDKLHVVFIYQYNEELHPNAIDTLKKILDSFAWEGPS